MEDSTTKDLFFMREVKSISPYFMVLNASGEIKIQIILFAIYTPLSFILKYYLSIIYGVDVIPMIGSIIYLLIIVIGIYYFANRKINSYKHNIIGS